MHFASRKAPAPQRAAPKAQVKQLRLLRLQPHGLTDIRPLDPTPLLHNQARRPRRLFNPVRPPPSRPTTAPTSPAHRPRQTRASAAAWKWLVSSGTGGSPRPTEAGVTYYCGRYSSSSRHTGLGLGRHGSLLLRRLCRHRDGGPGEEAAAGSRGHGSSRRPRPRLPRRPPARGRGRRQRQGTAPAAVHLFETAAPHPPLLPPPAHDGAVRYTFDVWHACTLIQKRGPHVGTFDPH